MTNNAPENTNPETETVEIVSKERKSLKPLVKKVLFWTGATVGVLAGAALISNTRRIADALEDSTVTIETGPDYLVVTEAEPLADPVDVKND